MKSKIQTILQNICRPVFLRSGFLGLPLLSWVPTVSLTVLMSCHPKPAPQYSELIQDRSKGLLVVGDTQRTTRSEKLLFQRESNARERKILLDHASLQDADLMVIVGDLVADGSSSSEWDFFDDLTQSFRTHNTPILPALGNHDYWGDNRKALHNFNDRFSWTKDPHWYWRAYADVALVFLDTNLSELSSDQKSAQKNVYRVGRGRWPTSQVIRRLGATASGSLQGSLT